MIEDSHEIITLLKAGDTKAFNTIYEYYYRGLFAFACQYVDKTDSEEIIQDVMLWLWENRLVVVPGLSLKSLLFAMVKNKCLNKVTHIQMKHRVHEQIYEKHKDKFEDPDFYVEEEVVSFILKAISELPEDYRNAFEMNRFENLTYSEIAGKTGVSSKTIAYRISQSLKILRIKLKGFYIW